MSTKQHKIKVGISIGDINGVGVEIILKSLAQKETLDFFTPIIFGSTKLLSTQKNFFNLDQLYLQGILKVEEAVDKKINVVNLWKEAPLLNLGASTEEAGKLAFQSLQAATKALKEGKIDVLVTAPINKNNIQSDAFQFAGHTEYLAHELGGEALMFLVSEHLKVAMVTQHIPLQEVAKHITEDKIIKKLKQMEKSLIEDFGINRPKMAVLGLNPHAGDNGLLGNEEKNIIIPALEKAQKSKLLAFGPYAADGFFSSLAYKNFDAVLGMYHDQVLIPFKTLCFEDGVNYTANLNKIRTSPDHGVAYDIAGQNKADASSFSEAIYVAIAIYKKRNEYQKLTANPLKKANLKEIEIDEDLPVE